jgi:hypothetical protein
VILSVSPDSRTVKCIISSLPRPLDIGIHVQTGSYFALDRQVARQAGRQAGRQTDCQQQPHY